LQRGSQEELIANQALILELTQQKAALETAKTDAETRRDQYAEMMEALANELQGGHDQLMASPYSPASSVRRARSVDGVSPVRLFETQNAGELDALRAELALAQERIRELETQSLGAAVVQEPEEVMALKNQLELLSAENDILRARLEEGRKNVEVFNAGKAAIAAADAALKDSDGDE